MTAEGSNSVRGCRMPEPKRKVEQNYSRTPAAIRPGIAQKFSLLMRSLHRLVACQLPSGGWWWRELQPCAFLTAQGKLSGVSELASHTQRLPPMQITFLHPHDSCRVDREALGRRARLKSVHSPFQQFDIIRSPGHLPKDFL